MRHERTPSPLALRSAMARVLGAMIRGLAAARTGLYCGWGAVRSGIISWEKVQQWPLVQLIGGWDLSHYGTFVFVEASR